MRKFGLILATLLLFFSLITLAISASSNIAFTHPKKVESWLSESNLYGAFVDNAIVQAQKTTGADGSGGVSLNDAAVKQAAQNAFSSQALQKNVEVVVNSNYAWLEGKTNKPTFRVDLSDAKQNFANNVGQYVTTYLKSLPVCTDAQLAAIDTSTADPLTLTCRPSNIDPVIAGEQVSQQISENGNFLSDPVVTADNINPDGTQYATPYYQQLSSLPQAYQVGQKLPWSAAAAVIAGMVGVFFLAARKRKGLKVIGTVLIVDGLILVATDFASDQVFNRAEKHIFNPNAIGEVQKALTTFFNHAESQLTKVNMWFGVAYIVVALVIMIALRATRQRDLNPFLTEEVTQAPKKPSRDKPSPSPKAASSGQPRKTAPPIPAAKKPVRRKPPRLVQ